MRVSALAAVAALAASVGCNNTPTSPNIISSVSNLSSFITSVQTVVQPTISGVVHGGSVSIVAGGPTVTATGPTSAIASGGNIFTLHATSGFQHLFVSVGNTGGAVATSGFYEIDTPAAPTDLQVLVQFGATLPSKTFDVQFQVTNTATQGGPTAAVTTTVATDTSTLAPAVLASYSPSPAPFLGGVNCALSTQKGCLWEFSVVLQETNGVGIPSAVMTETFTFGTTVITRTLNVTIPAHGVETATRNFACGTGGTACATPAELAGGTYTYTVAGTDQNLNTFTLTGPVLTLNHQ
jgi:hypothetical protein